MRAAALSLLMMFMVVGFAHAQAPSIAEFASDPGLKDASVSPSGRYVAAISQTPDGDRLIIIDWADGSVTPIAQTVRGRQLTDVYLNWISWKTEDRLIYSISAIDARPGVPTEMRSAITRVQSVNRAGGDMQEMLERRTYSWVVLADTLPSDPDHVLIETPDGNGVALFRANVLTGAARRVESAHRYVGGWYMNREGVPVFRLEYPRRGSGYRIARRAPGTNAWRDVTEVLAETFEHNREFYPIAPGPRPEQMYVAARPEGGDHTAVYLYDTSTGALGEPVAQSDRLDIDSIIRAPQTYELAASCTYETTHACRGATPEFEQDWRTVVSSLRQYGEVSLADASEDGNIWLLHAEGATNPGLYAVYSRTEQRLSLVGRARPALTADRLSPMSVVRYRARDGAELWGYLTRPAAASGPLPLVVLPHGGPESRDYARFDFLVQFLASRGYAVFQPQFRGSEGFGRAFAEQGYGEWGGRMQDDVTDSVRHLIESGVADAGRVCIAGISYGGYAALAGAAMTPDLYQCAIGVAGVYDLIDLVRDERVQHGSRSLSMAYLRRTLGGIEDRQRLAAISPSRLADRINIPVLLIHGDEDYVADVSHSIAMRDALTEAGKDVRYVEVSAAGHPYDRWRVAERTLLLTEIERFLAAHLAPAAP